MKKEKKIRMPRRAWHLIPKQKWHSTVKGAKDYDRKAGKNTLRKELGE